MALHLSRRRLVVVNQALVRFASSVGLLPGAWQKTYDAKNKLELCDAYKQWAGTYEQDSIGTFGYRAPDVAASELARLLDDRNARILDVGAGTGLVGARLAEKGFTRIVGVDLSVDMMREAAAKKCYEQLMLSDIAHMDTPDQSFDGSCYSNCSEYTTHESDPGLLRASLRGAVPPPQRR
jgi:SAM-dependent methyltransferase